MEGKKLANFLLLMIVLDLLLLSSTEASPWWRRRNNSRRRCSSNQPSGVAWANNWQQYFKFSCKLGTSLRKWESEHRNCKEDRIHHFKCGKAPISYSESDCSWTYFVNDYDLPLTFRCANNGFIAGVASVFAGGIDDRRFKFRCCHSCSFIQHSCKHTLYQNNWDGKVNYKVPEGYYLVGAHSYHDNGKEDRRWRFEICTFNRRRRGQK